MKKMDVPISLKPPDINYKGMSGPWLDSYFDREIDDPVDGWTYVPIYWSALRRHRFGVGLKWFERNRSPGDKYFTIVLDDIGLPYTPDNLLVFGANSGDVHIPLSPRHVCRVGLPKSLYWNFLGSIARHVDYKGVRSRAIRACKPIVPNVTQHQPLPFIDYCATMEISAFTLAPRGFGPTSFRLYEAMAVGSVPIYVWVDKLILPFQDEIDWNEISVVIKMEDLGGIRDRMASVDHMKAGNRAYEAFHEYFDVAAVARRIVAYLNLHSSKYSPEVT